MKYKNTREDRLEFLNVSLLKASFYCTYHQVQHSKILYGAILHLCSVWTSEQIGTSALYSTKRLVLYNRGEECLLRGTRYVLM